MSAAGTPGVAAAGVARSVASLGIFSLFLTAALMAAGLYWLYSRTRRRAAPEAAASSSSSSIRSLAAAPTAKVSTAEASSAGTI